MNGREPRPSTAGGGPGARPQPDVGAAAWRAEVLRNLRENPEVSVLILGGGINGAGLFRELALQGVDCLLLDRADFASGATSKSSRMIHGGLRYLENREFGLVCESLRERNRLIANAPHFVSPLRTTIPLFSRWGGIVKSPLVFLGLPVRPGGRGAFIVKLGLSFYDLVTRSDRRMPAHIFTSREESLRAFPGLNPEIQSTATYWDATISQAERLCIELIQDARGADPRSRALNYAAVRGTEGGAVRIADSITGETLRIRPRVVVNATGAWVDRTNAALGLETRLMSGTKGSHLVVESRALHDALGGGMIYYEHSDGRVCIAFPFGGKVIMGSTDIPVDDPDAARCDDGEVEYMKATLRGVFPGIEISPAEIIHMFSGVRPLPAAGERIVGTITRGHRIAAIEPEGGRPFPVFSLIGGKWTTFRSLAAKAADRILPCLGATRRVATEALPIGGGKDYPSDDGARGRWIEGVAEASGLAARRISVLLGRFGTSAEGYARSLPKGKETPLESLPDYTREEIEHVGRTESVEHLADLIFRRSTIALEGLATREALEEIAGVLAGFLHWDPARQEAEAEAARAEIARG